jgi:hypothetical protein
VTFARIVVTFLLLTASASAADISRMAPVLDVQGIVEGDVTLAAGRIGVEAEITGDLVLAGATIGVGAATRVARNAFIFGDAVAMGGQYAQRVWVVGNEAVLDLRSTGDVSIAAARVIVGPNARIGGRLKVWSADAAEIHPTAVIAGGVEQNFGGAGNAIEALMGFVGMVIRWVYNVAMVLVAVALGLWAPGFLAGAAERVAHEPMASLLAGLLLAVLLPLAAMFGAITLVGIPLAGALILFLAAALALGYVVTVAYVGGAGLKLVGRAVAPNACWRAGAMLFGLVVLAALRHIPVLGTPVLVAAYVFGLGALALEIHRRLR